MTRFRRRLGRIAAILSIAVLAGCTSKPAGTDTAATKTPDPSKQAAPAAPVPGGTLVIAQGADVLTLDPALTTDEASGPVQSLLFNRLVRFDDKMQPAPDLAEKWDVKDGKVFTFTLRQGVKFHNGELMKASDVKFSIDRMSDPAVKSRWASYFTDVAEVKVVDEKTVQVTLKNPNAAFLSAIASYVSILQEAFVKANPNLQRVENGTGPYNLKEWVPNSALTVTRFTDFFDKDKTYINDIVFKIIPEDASRMAALRTGDVQFLSFGEPQYGPQLEQMKNAGQITMDRVVTNTYHLLGFNVKRKPFDNEKVRQAIQYAVDREQLLKTAAFGQGAVSGILSPALGDWVVSPDKYPEYKRDVAKAKQLLKEAGYENGFEFKIMAPSTYPVDLNSAVTMAEQLKEVGIKVTVDKTEWGTYVKNWVDRNFDGFVGHNGDWTDPDLAMFAALTTGGSTNAAQYSDPEIDQLLNKGRITADQSERKKIYDEVQIKLVAKGPMVYTFATYQYYAASPKLQGYHAEVVGAFRNLAYTWLTK